MFHSGTFLRSAARCLTTGGLLLAASGAHAQPVLDIPSFDGTLTHAAWKPSGSIKRWIVSLHGSEGSAKADVADWQKSLGGRPLGVLAIQWWRGRGNDYLPPFEIYREIDFAASKLDIKPGNALLHGFSRGSVYLYTVAAIDNGLGRKLFSLYVASSGGVAPHFPPIQAILDGRFGPRPLAGTHWVTACGEYDPRPDRDGCPAMRRTGKWLQEQGAILLDAIEDPQSGHGALQLNPRNAQRLLDMM